MQIDSNNGYYYFFCDNKAVLLAFFCAGGVIYVIRSIVIAQRLVGMLVSLQKERNAVAYMRIVNFYLRVRDLICYKRLYI